MKNQVLLLNEIRDQLRAVIERLELMKPLSLNDGYGGLTPSYGTINVSNKDLWRVITNTLPRQFNLEDNGLNSLKNEDYEPKIGEWVIQHPIHPTNRILYDDSFIDALVKFQGWHSGNSFGFDFMGKWINNFHFQGPKDGLYSKPTKEQIETRLREHCRILGIDDDTKLECDGKINCIYNTNDGGYGLGYGLGYDLDRDELWNRNGVIYKNGWFSRPLGSLRPEPIQFKTAMEYNGGAHFYDFFPSDKPQIGDKINLNNGVVLEIIDKPTQVSDKGYCFGVKKI